MLLFLASRTTISRIPSRRHHRECRKQCHSGLRPLRCVVRTKLTRGMSRYAISQISQGSKITFLPILLSMQLRLEDPPSLSAQPSNILASARHTTKIMAAPSQIALVMEARYDVLPRLPLRSSTASGIRRRRRGQLDQSRRASRCVSSHPRNSV